MFKVQKALSPHEVIPVKFYKVPLPVIFILLAATITTILTIDITGWLGLFIFFMIALIGISMTDVPIVKNYWKNNIIGHNIFLWQEKNDQIGHCIASRKNQTLRDIPFTEEAVIVTIPLGGWFNRTGRILWYHNSRINILQFWKTKLRVDSFHEPIFNHCANETKLRLIDGNGIKLDFDIVDALNFLKYYGRRHSNWESIINQKTEEKTNQTQTKISEKIPKEIIKEHQEFIAEFIERLNSTRRFIHSKEGQSLREWVEGKLAQLKTEE